LGDGTGDDGTATEPLEATVFVLPPLHAIRVIPVLSATRIVRLEVRILRGIVFQILI
jgi:hypothetical protein